MRFMLLAAFLLPLHASANPTGGTVTSGSATISSSGSTVTVNTTTTGTVINWNSFSISAGETTRINQPGASSATLNRVTGPSSSSINGSLQSNGQVFLVNPNGIVFGSTASVNVAGFVASTLDIADSDFLSGNYRFTASGTPGSIVNNGSLVATTAYLALIAPNISSTTTLTVPPGGLALAAGASVTLTAPGGVLTNATAGSSIPGSAINVSSIDSVGGSGQVFIVTGSSSGLPGGTCATTLGGVSSGGCGSGGSAIPMLPIVVGPGAIVSGGLPLNQSTSSGTVTTTSFGIGTTGSLVTTGGSTTTLGTSGSGVVLITGTLMTSGTSPSSITAATSAPTGAGAATFQAGQAVGVALNLEKKELSF
jgi:filamentous hemagglutinin family protein